MENTPVKLSYNTEQKIIDSIVKLAQIMGEVEFYPYQSPFARRLTQSILTNEGATLTALFSRQCIAEDSLIMDRTGKVLPIQKHSEAWKTKDAADIWEIKTFGGHTILCTEEHPIATPRGFVSAFCLQPKDKVIVLDRWNKFGNGRIPLGDSGAELVINNELAELVGWFTAYIGETDDVKVIQGKDRVIELVDKYLDGAKYKTTKNQVIFKIEGRIMSFLRAMKFNASGFPENVNYFTRDQLINFFGPLFLIHGKAYKKPTTVKTILKWNNKRFLLFAKEHLNKLGLHGNYETWIGDCLIFQCNDNFFRMKELFVDFLPANFFPPHYVSRNRTKKCTLGEDGEELIEARVSSVKKLDKQMPVWDTTIEDKGWFLCSGAKVHNSGKTQVVAMITAACMVMLPNLAAKFPQAFGLFSKGFWAGCFGPVGEQAVTMFDRIYTVFTTDTSKKLFIEELKMPIPAQGGARGNLIKLANKSFVRYMSSSKRAKVESKTYHLIILDECQDMESFKVKKSILPMGAAVNATVVATGTPDIYIGFFYDMIEQNKARDIEEPHKQCHFEVDYTIAQRYNAMYRTFVNKQKRDLLEDSDEFKMAYRLIWPITKGMVFTKAQLDEKCYDKSLKVTKAYKETPCIAGLDLGKSQDSTVVTVIKPDWSCSDEEGNMPKVLLDWLELEGDNWEDQYPKVVDFLSNYYIDTLVCDSTGVGDPVREHYAAILPNVNVIPFVFSPTSKDIGYKYLMQEVNQKRILIPAHATVRSSNKFKKFELQMTTIKKHYSGKFLNPCPVDAEKGHDDYPDSLMLAVFGTYFEVMPEMEVTDNDIWKNYRDDTEMYGKKYSKPIVRG
jgi:hypothetical protein